MNYKIKSHHKRNSLPLFVFVTCAILWFLSLGTLWGIILPVPIGLSAAWWGIWNGDRVGKSISAWIERDGWR